MHFQSAEHLYGSNGDYVEKGCHFVLNKLRDKKYFRLSFDSPLYISIGLLEYIDHKKFILQFCKRHCN